MASDPFTYTPPRVFGAPDCRWRALRRPSGALRIERQILPGGAWTEQTDEEIRGEIAHQTDAGRWLVRLVVAGLMEYPHHA